MKIRLFAVSVYHAHGFGCLGVAKTEAGARKYIDAWKAEWPNTSEEDQFDISQVEFDPEEAS